MNKLVEIPEPKVANLHDFLSYCTLAPRTSAFSSVVADGT